MTMHQRCESPVVPVGLPKVVAGSAGLLSGTFVIAIAAVLLGVQQEPRPAAPLAQQPRKDIGHCLDLDIATDFGDDVGVGQKASVALLQSAAARAAQRKAVGSRDSSHANPDKVQPPAVAVSQGASVHHANAVSREQAKGDGSGSSAVGDTHHGETGQVEGDKQVSQASASVAPGQAVRGPRLRTVESSVEFVAAQPFGKGPKMAAVEWLSPAGADMSGCEALALGRDMFMKGFPLTAVARVQLEVFHRLGLISLLRDCQASKALRYHVNYTGYLSVLAVHTGRGGVAEKAGAGGASRSVDREEVAAWLVGAWGVFAVGLIMWSLSGVARVPPKRNDDKTTPSELNLADEEGAWKKGVLHWVSLSWADDLMGRYGKCSATTASDAELVKERADSDYEPHRRFRRAWDEQIQRAGSIEKASLVWALQKVIGNKGCALLVVAVLIEVGMSMVGMVVALDLLLGYLQAAYEAAERDPSRAHIDMLEPTIRIIVLVFGVPMVYRLASVVVTLLDGYYTNLCAAGLASIVYEKALSLPAGSEDMGSRLPGRRSGDDGDDDDAARRGGGEDAGLKPNVVQLLNVDIIEAWGYLLKTMVYTAVAPLAALALLGMLVMRLRLAGLLGALYVIPVLLVTWFVQTFNVTSWQKYQTNQDARLGQLSELLTHIRVIKALGWEKLFQKRIGEARDKELGANFACAVTSGCTQANLHAIPWFSMAISLGLVCFLRGSVEARHIFVVQRITMSMLSLLHVMYFGMQKFVAVPNSLARVKAFLLQQERPRSAIGEPAMDRQAPAVRLVGSFAFDVVGEPVLRNLDIAIPRGELVAVVGGVGSGKSAFLLSVIGELFPRGPRPVIEAPSNVAYCAQVPWIFEGTLRENVTLNQVHEADRYNSILHDSSLLQDVQTLPGGDLATIGSFGIRLSGGQRARIALARAAYMEHTELVLLDDPLASMDAATGQKIFDELLLGAAMQGRTRIMVTQPSIARLKKFDRVILLEEGRVAVAGPPGEVLASAAFARLVEGPASGGLSGVSHATPTPMTSTGPFGNPDGAPGAPQGLVALPRTAAAGTEVANVARDLTVLQSAAGLGPRIPAVPAGAAQLRDLEVQDRFSWATVKMWLQAAGYGKLTLFVILVMCQRLLFLGESLVLASWVDVKVTTGASSDRTYLCLLVGVVTASCASFIFLYWAAGRLSMTASRSFHDQVLASLLQAPIDRFFDRQPIGRILNRFSFDLRFVDNAIAFCVLMMVAFCFGFLITQGYILSEVTWTVASCAMPIYGLLFYYVYLYRGTAVPLVFHSKFALSCIQDLQGVVMSSCVSIRANGMSPDFMARHNHYSATIIRCQYLIFHVAKAWVQSRVTLCFSALTVLFALGGLWTRMPMGTLANIVSLSFISMQEFETVAQMFANSITVLNSLQRLARLLTTPQEAPAVTGADPKIRLSVLVSRMHLASLEAKRGVEAEASLPEGVDAEKSWLYFRPLSIAGTGGHALQSPAQREMRRTSLAVFLKGQFPLFRASQDNCSLELLDGRRLRDLAPGCAALQGLEDSYSIVAVNGIARSAGSMAEELCNPPAAVWLDLWQSKYAGGMRVQLEDLSAGYGNDPSVLRGISIDVPACARFGLVGKSGCGKTTALQCILRLLEPRSGRILLGGLDASKLGLAALRSIVGIVPQEPVLFRGSWRENLDPFNQYPDGRLWEALQNLALMPLARSSPGGLDAPVCPSGANISLGQKQLLSIARMLVRQPPVLLLDECTSALDPHSQEVARNSIMNDFPMSTVLAAAHRAEALRGFGSVVVLEDGEVVKRGSTEEILKIDSRTLA
mmetsp:Transcript_14103/g.49655  ORF Transcript_14103/g.49655 Transcript_14103/m.49655 type:complete len:1809 (-) Transcript_14103:188-5614(-)